MHDNCDVCQRLGFDRVSDGQYESWYRVNIPRGCTMPRDEHWCFSIHHGLISKSGKGCEGCELYEPEEDSVDQRSVGFCKNCGHPQSEHKGEGSMTPGCLHVLPDDPGEGKTRYYCTCPGYEPEDTA